MGKEVDVPLRGTAKLIILSGLSLLKETFLSLLFLFHDAQFAIKSGGRTDVSQLYGTPP
jgi:hypothetical protein